MFKKDNRGFSMVEILAVIVIIGIIAGVGIPAALHYINTSREDSFFQSVTEAIDKVSETNSMNGATYCVYENKAAVLTAGWDPTEADEAIREEQAEKTEDIDKLFVFSWTNTEGKKMYAVYAESKETGAVIDTADFYSLTMKNKKNWNEEDSSSMSYNKKIEEIEGDLTNYKNDYAKCEQGGTR